VTECWLAHPEADQHPMRTSKLYAKSAVGAVAMLKLDELLFALSLIHRVFNAGLPTCINQSGTRRRSQFMYSPGALVGLPSTHRTLTSLDSSSGL
jgi:hypothetical protein